MWIGAGALGERDGRVALYRRERLAALLASVESAEALASLSPAASRVHAALAARGASFFSEIAAVCAASPSISSQEVERGLWDLVWQGLVTNDTFAPLRARQKPPPARARRPGRNAPPSATSGRWSLVRSLLREAVSPTELLHRRTVTLLERHGIVSRESLDGESLPGGFGAIYPVLREMEEMGRVRRGHFWLGASSAQFALAGVVDRMRAFRACPANPEAILLASLDPAQPWGAQLDWPAVQAGRPRRAVGSAVVLVDGKPSLFVERGGRSLLVFRSSSRRDDTAIDSEDARVLVALRALAAGAERLGVKRLAVEQIDGEPARSAGLAPVFEQAGFRVGYRGYEIERLRR